MLTINNLQNRSKEIDEESPRGYNNDLLWKLQMDKGFPYNIAILSKYFIDLKIHFVKGKGAVLCDKMYFEKGDPEAYCEECTKPGYMGEGINYPATVRVFVGYCFDLKDQKGKTKKGDEFTHNPLKLIEVQAGGRKCPNWEKLEEASNEDCLVFDPSEADPSVWRFKRKEDKGMDVPSILHPKDAKKLPYKTEVPEEILLEWGTKTQGEILGIILSAYGNLKKELFSSDFIFPETTKSEEDAGETKELDLD